MYIAVFNLFYLWIKSLILGTQCLSKHQDLQTFGLKFFFSNFHPFKGVGRGSETLLQVDENLNKLP